MDERGDSVMWSFTGQGSAVSYAIDVENGQVVATSRATGVDILIPMKDIRDIANISALRSEMIMAWAAKKVAMDEIGMRETEKPKR